MLDGSGSGVEGLLVGVAADSGRLLWKVPFTTEYTQNAVTPVVQGSVVIVSGLDHPVRALRVVAAKGGGWTAETVWENPDVALYMSSPVLVAGRLYGFSHKKKGQFFCLDAATGKNGGDAAFKVLRRYPVAETPTWAHVGFER